MTPVLIDLHVRPVLNEFGQPDAELLAVQARDHGLDGVVVVGENEAVLLGDTEEISRATGVSLFVGVELLTDAGPLVCFPRTADDWYRDAGWRSLPQAPAANGPTAVYAADAVVRLFAERGGAVLAPAGTEADSPSRPAGLSALEVTTPAASATERGADPDAEGSDSAEGSEGTDSADDAAASVAAGLDESALRAAYAARLPCVAGSRSVPGEARFGAVATLFASPPTAQEMLVDGLRSGRVWPAEIGSPWMYAALQPRRAAPPAGRRQGEVDDQRRGDNRPPQGERPPREEGQEPDRRERADTPRENQRDYQNPRENLQRGESQQRESAPREQHPNLHRKQGRYHDPQERPGDARGNRLNREALRRRISPAMDDGVQPAFDPVAAMYGLDGRKIRTFSGKSDIELDRINGNRAKGPDPNVMVLPAFDELRQERQHLNLLFSQTEQEDDESDSISLTWALNYFRDEDGQPNRDLSHLPAGNQARTRRRRRR